MDLEIHKAVSRRGKEMTFLLLHESDVEAIVCKLTHSFRKHIVIIRLPRMMLAKNHSEAEWIPVDRKLVGLGAYMDPVEAHSYVDAALAKYKNSNDAEPFRSNTINVIGSLLAEYV